VALFIGWVRRAVDGLRALPVLAVDVGIAVVCYAATVVSANTRAPQIVLLAAVATMPLVWRRRYPLAVTFVCGLGTTWLSLLHGIDEQPFGQLVATYTFAALSGPLARLVGVLGTAAGVTTSILMPGGSALHLALVGMLFAVAYALGTSARARRDRIALLEERARRLAEEQEAAAAREREAIARDMHDILAHSVSLIAVQAEAGPVLVRPDPDRAVRAFDAIGAAARDTLVQLRQTLGSLRGAAPALAPQPDLDNLPVLAERAREAGLQVTVAEHGYPRPLPPGLGTAAYRVVQESLTNVVRHANAGRVAIGLDWSTTGLRIDVSDDGAGVSGRGTSRPGGQGLIGMRERLAAFGGVLHAGPRTDGAGFRVTATLPLAPGPAGD